tara:strand:- start:143 stop:394 length:252 start_codon:yes stop_codon:yes gene_type:complete
MPKRMLNGKVISCKSNKTVVVEVTRRVKHKLYKKIIKRVKKYHVHSENNSFNVGDTVIIQESRPISKLKKWVIKDRIEIGSTQ